MSANTSLFAPNTNKTSETRFVFVCTVLIKIARENFFIYLRHTKYNSVAQRTRRNFFFLLPGVSNTHTYTSLPCGCYLFLVYLYVLDIRNLCKLPRTRRYVHTHTHTYTYSNCNITATKEKSHIMSIIRMLP